MRTIANMANAVASVSILDVMVDSLQQTKDQYLVIQKDQLYHGINSIGTHLLSYRSKAYATLKNQMNPLPGMYNPDLRKSGAFYAAFKGDVTQLGITVYSTDSKAGMLEAKYGKSIWTLFTVWKEQYITTVLAKVFLNNVMVSLGQFEESPF